MCIAAPVFLVFLLHQTARDREISSVIERLQSDLDRQVEIVLNDSFNVLDAYAFSAPDSCEEQSKAALQRLAFTSVYVKDLLVTDSNTVICSTSGHDRSIRRRAPPQNLVSGARWVEAVQIESEQVEALLISRALGDDKTLSALVLSNSLVVAGNHQSLLEGGFVFLTLADGTDIGRYPRSTLFASAMRDMDDFTIVNGSSATPPFEMKILIANERLQNSQANSTFWISMFGAFVFGSALCTGLCYLNVSQESSMGPIELAIKDRQFLAVYQPIVDIETGNFIGCEALIRLQKPDGTLIHPDLFIEDAEASGLALEMTVLLMKSIKADLGALYGRRASLKVCINLFSDHLNRLETVTEIERIFSTSSIRFDQLTFELTERMPVESSEVAKNVIAGIQSLGSQVALDDVGTGHNGLKYLMELGVDIIKIDKLFIDGVSESGFSKTIVDALIKLAREMDILVVAEGVERLDQVAKLKELGVQMAQGYFYSRPLAPQAYIAFMEEAMSEGNENLATESRQNIPQYLKLVNENDPVSG